MESEARIISVPFSDLIIDQKEIENSLGYDHTMPDPYIQAVVTNQLSELANLNSYKFGYRHLDGLITGKKSIQLGEIVFNPKLIITRCLEGSSSFILLVATVGEEVDHWINQKNDGNDIVEAFIADILGSVIVESVVRYGLQYIENEMSAGDLRISNSYSPGYCGWNIMEQQAFFSLLPEKFCGITLTQSDLMLPIKSVSAIVGVGKNVEKKEYGCEICNKKDCYKRYNKERGRDI